MDVKNVTDISEKIPASIFRIEVESPLQIYQTT
jgi:hypothetical protein